MTNVGFVILSEHMQDRLHEGKALIKWLSRLPIHVCSDGRLLVPEGPSHPSVPLGFLALALTVASRKGAQASKTFQAKAILS